MAHDRFVPSAVQEILKRRDLRFDLARYIEHVGSAVAVTFPQAGATVQVAHGLGVVPEGRHVILQTGAVYDVAIEKWTADLAFLVAPVAGTYARVIFFRLRDPYTGP